MIYSILKLIYYPFSAVFYLCFGAAIVIFHPIQWICFTFFGYKAHKNSVDILNWLLLRCLNILGTRFSFYIEAEIPKGVPLIIVANHQSMWDIPPIIWYLRKLDAAFISKKELGRGIPSISYNLRHGMSVLIDRKKPEEAIDKIIKIAKYATNTTRSVVIFPEGTRSRDWNPKAFKTTGLKTLLQHMPNAYVLPISVNNSWKLQRFGIFPMQVGVHLKHHVHPAIKVSAYANQDLLFSKIEELIATHVVEK
jgi:1-acyl-sn-glycerol-3-phosphate acyltransferase